MKRSTINNLTRLTGHLVAVWLLVVLTGSCVIELTPEQRGETGLSEHALAIAPAVQGSDVVLTKTPGDDQYGENDLVSLDIFVYKYNGSTLDASAPYKTYHLPKGAATGSLNGAGATDYQLESDWTTNYASGTYRIYAVANNDKTHDASGNVPSLSESALLELQTDSPVTYNDENDHAYAPDIVRLKSTDGQDPTGRRDVHIKDKVFQMDGMIDNWSPTPGQTKQYFTLKPDSGQYPLTFDLRRTAAKIDLTVSYSSSFLTRLTNWTAIEWHDREHNQPKTQELITNIDTAQFKFVNFGTHAYDITYALGRTNEDPPLYSMAGLWTSDQRFNFPMHTPSSEGQPETNPYQLITYSYPFRWTTGEEAVDFSPAILVSVGYTIKQRSLDESGTQQGSERDLGTTYNYYRIPLVDDALHCSIERNTLYKIIAEIDSKGSSSLEADPTPVNLKYQVIPWITNTSTDVTEVTATELYYFTAEQYYTLRGNDWQDCNLRFFTPAGYAPVVSNISVTYKDANGTPQSSPTYTANNVTADNYSITVNSNPDGGGTFYINSRALDNRAVKYITFTATVYFDINNDGDTDDAGEQVPLDFTIKHFPLDNIQSVNGAWSSRWSETTGNYTAWETSYDWEADGWSSYHHYETTYGATETIARSLWTAKVPQNERYDAEGVNNAYSPGDGYQYWGSENNYSNATDTDYDWYSTRYGYRRYTTVYRRSIKTIYYRSLTVTGPTVKTGWVDWSLVTRNNDGTFSGTTGTTVNDRDNITFNAKFYGGYYQYNNYCYNISYSNSNQRYSGTAQTGLTNNHMYIIQISKAENGVKIGRPILNGEYQSSDEVVSPAFMIASQLGAVGGTANYSAAAAQSAAKHCATYMEVDNVGRRFARWRLPTAAEVDYILGYQTNDKVRGQGVFENVMTGRYYYILPGGNSSDNGARYTGIVTNNNNAYYVRCVRDLTPKEVAELNSTGTITVASYE